MYLEAIGVQSACVEAVYNLGLVNMQLGRLKEARIAFEKLHRLIPNNLSVLYRIANVCEQQDEPDETVKWLNVLSSRIPMDAGVLSRIGGIYTKANNEGQAFHYQIESHRLFPIDLDVISWLGVWFVKNKMYEKSICLFERASQIQPKEAKWPLMICSCYRCMGNCTEARDMYEWVHAKYPENLECEFCQKQKFKRLINALRDCALTVLYFSHCFVS